MTREIRSSFGMHRQPAEHCSGSSLAQDTPSHSMKHSASLSLGTLKVHLHSVTSAGMNPGHIFIIYIYLYIIVIYKHARKRIQRCIKIATPSVPYFRSLRPRNRLVQTGRYIFIYIDYRYIYITIFEIILIKAPHFCIDQKNVKEHFKCHVSCPTMNGQNCLCTHLTLLMTVSSGLSYIKGIRTLGFLQWRKISWLSKRLSPKLPKK
jgi:hypothetical protein